MHASKCVFLCMSVLLLQRLSLTIQCEPRRLRLESGFQKFYRIILQNIALSTISGLTYRENETKIKLQPCKKNIFSGEFQSNSVIRAGTVGNFD